MFKRSILILTLVALMTVALVGCSQSTPSATDGGNKPTELSGSLITAGSTSVQPVSELLAEGFMARHKGVRITVQGGGSSQGVTAAKNGTAQIGASSRDLKSEEKQGVYETIIARDGIAMVVNSANPVIDMSIEQVRKIYAGEIKNWKEVGGVDAPIVVVTRDEASGTRGAFEEIIMGKERIINEAVVQTSGGAIVAAVEGNPHAIGYVSFSGINTRIKTVKIDGAAPIAENVSNGSYKVQRPFIYITKEAPSGLIKEFVDFILSAEGQQIVEKAGLLKVK